MNFMKNKFETFRIGTFILIIFISIIFCSEDKSDNSGSDIWDIDKQGIPQFVNYNYIGLHNIYRISKFRSSVGHDYSDAFEHCRSLKHYFEPRGNIDWSAIDIYAPVTGEITRVENEWAGTKIEIESEQHPAFRIAIFHVNLDTTRSVGEKIHEGDHLGRHIGSQTYSDIAVIVNDPTRQGRFVSYMEVLTESVFIEFKNKGINFRSDLIIPQSLRDSFPLTCNGDQFLPGDPLENWVYMK